MPCNVFDNEELVKQAKERLNEVIARRESDVEAIKSWMKKEPHLGKQARHDEEFILANLRGCKFSLERTKEKIDSWHTLRTHAKDMFEGWDPKDPSIMELLELGVNVPLDGYDKHGRKVILLRTSLANQKKIPLMRSQKVMLLVNELLQKRADFQMAVNGLVIINDLAGSNFEYLAQMTPSMGKKVITILTQGYPASPKENHIMNMAPLIEKVVSMVMSFSGEKLRQRTRFYATDDDLSKLHEAVGKDVLPEEYGGNAGPIRLHIERVKKEAMANRDWLKQQCKFQSLEKKRRGQQKMYADIFGMEGSFRKLEID